MVVVVDGGGEVVVVSCRSLVVDDLRVCARRRLDRI
jgi:hypothetical protein